MTILKLITLFLFGACSTMQAPVKSEYAPKNYQSIGVVKYSTSGAEFVVNYRRESAFKSMHEQCGGNYEIVSEGEKVSERSYSSLGNNVYENSSNEWEIKFKCLK